jgi:hypothetical protein
MLCLACEYRRSEGSAGLTGYILWPAAVPWTGGSLSVSCSRATRKFGRCAGTREERRRGARSAAGQYQYQYAAFSIPTMVQTVTAAAGVQ